MEFDEKYSYFFFTKKFANSFNYSLTFLFQKNTYIFRLGSHFLMQYPGLTEVNLIRENYV